MAEVVRYGRWIAGIALAVGYALLAHYTNTNPSNETLGTLVALAPIVLAVLAMAWNSHYRKAMLAAISFGCVALVMAWNTLEHHFHWIYWIEHAGTQFILCLVFARTLRAGREPMCSYFARMVHGSLEPALARYTRQITVAWVVFFGLMSLTSTVLFFAAPITIWSVFVNFFTGPLICLMFVLEYGARRYLLPDMKHVHIFAAVNAMRKTPVGQAPKQTKIMPTLPLITHSQADRIFAWRDGHPVSAARFLFDVAQLRDKLPDGGHMLNACNDRYRFTVGLAAAMTSKKVSLLPSTTTPEMIRQLLLFAPDAFCLTDSDDCSVALPQIRFPAIGEPDAIFQTFAVPQINGEQLVAYVFTSGSTGAPLPHRKTWAALVRNVQAEAQLCGLNDGRQHAVIGTVPPQHMYGFESTVLMVMQSANAMVVGPTFFSADICNTIASAPRPRTLVSTPVHLRSVIGAGLEIPLVDLLVSATAPLSSSLAKELEAHFQAPLLEIYGSTETGQIAVRKPTQTQTWTLFPEIRFTQQDEFYWANGGHVEIPTRMQDVIEPIDEHHFLLHGRTADLINIAGKRSSLMYLNLQLNAIPGVVDAAFFMPDEPAEDVADKLAKNVVNDGVTRLTAFVVAPELTAATLMTALRERIDPVFLPRPLIFVDSLPRNATGKLPREALKSLLPGNRKPATSLNASQTSGQAQLAIAPDHPAYAGHFPGTPIVPGVVLLDEALHAIGKLTGFDLSACQISAVKFLSPVRPGEPVSVRYETQGNDPTNLKFRFDIVSDERKVATGSIRVAA